jgi:NADH:ubiquinone oxidoreductase subunit F (NADH-binding)
VLVVNMMEGEPASQKDGALLSGAPHLVLEGAQLAAMATGAREIVICTSVESERLARHAEAAISDRHSAGADRIPTRVSVGPGGYVAGEESALVKWIGGGRAVPAFRSEKGSPLTIGRRAALVQNGETLAHVALVARYGPAWFRSAGLHGASGTALVTVSGSVEHPGVYEVELGETVSEILARARVRLPIGAFLVGGYGGAWLPAGDVDVPFAPSTLAKLGGGTGPGIIVALGSLACGVAETARIAAYLAGESAGQCGPCRFGLSAIADDLARLAGGSADEGALQRLRRRLDVVKGRGACSHPDGAVRLVRSALDVFAADLSAHARRQPCAASQRGTGLRFHR